MPSSEVTPDPRSVCSDCPGLAGGESSDFGGGSPLPCTVFEQRFPISDARAIELGFDMARTTALIEREIDAPLRWTLNDTGQGTPPTGFEPRTRIEGRVRRSDWLTHVALDPTRCEGSTCSDEVYGEHTCLDSLELGVEVELRTLDGAVNATASGYALLHREGFFTTPAGSQRADLRDVTGSLELFPPESPRLVFALLMTDLYFKPDQIEGDMRPSFFVSAGVGTEGQYVPLSGHWPDVPMPPDDPAQASPLEP